MAISSSVELSRIGRYDHSVQPNSNRLNVQNFKKTRQPVELSRIVAVIIAPDPTQLNWLSWVGRSERRFSRILSGGLSFSVCSWLRQCPSW